MSEQTWTQIEKLVSQLTFEQQIIMVERLAHRLRQAIEMRQQPRDLYGIWQGHFPASFDLDTTLNDIRREWEHEWPLESLS